MKTIQEEVQEFLIKAEKKELKERTIKKYKRYLNEFINYTGIKTKEDITKDLMINYKEHLREIHPKESSINNKIVMLNKFILSLDFPEEVKKEIKLKQYKIQKHTTLEDVLTQTDYDRMLRISQARGKIKMYYLQKTLAGTGIRIGELQYITVEAVNKGSTKVENKGKIRTIVISKKLAKELKQYCKDNNITTGIIFKGKSGKALDNAYVWRELQWIAGQARVKKSKIHPHSYRHLFAKSFIAQYGNNSIMQLADILGHSRLETTRIYTQSSISEQRDLLDNMNI